MVVFAVDPAAFDGKEYREFGTLEKLRMKKSS